MDCRPPGSSVRGILQARLLEWVAVFSSRESFQHSDGTCVSLSPALQMDCLPLSYWGNPHKGFTEVMKSSPQAESAVSEGSRGQSFLALSYFLLVAGNLVFPGL